MLIQPVIFLSLFILLSFVPLVAAVTVEKTPNDVYRQAQGLADDVRMLRRRNSITTAWPRIEVEFGHEPRHVFQKALEILSKINSYRIKIANTGGITVPRFPGRDITPNEVFSVVVRLRQELALLVPYTGERHDGRHYELITNKTPSDVYAALSEVSIALEETLGLRGITPSEVYMRSLRVIELVRFLRRSQNLSLEVPMPLRTHGKLSNHALKAVLELQKKIQLVEKNLWMKSIKVPILPRRVITPSDVYDAMGVVIAELQSIQYRLGLEREFSDPEPQRDKNPDDVILNATWAMTLLPEFGLDKQLQQYDRLALKKTPDEVFAITEYILDRLKLYRRVRGIKVSSREVVLIPDLKPKHVYEKALDVLQKLDVLRRSQSMGAIAVPRYPLRTITPTEVFDLVLRLDEELTQVYNTAGLESALWITRVDTKEFEGKQPSDVFYNLQKIANIIDTIIGSEGSTPNDVYREVVAIKREVQILADNLSINIPASSWIDIELKPATTPHEVLIYTQEVLTLIVKAKQRAGMFGVRNIMLPRGAVVTPSDVFNQVRLIKTELIELKVFLSIADIPDLPEAQVDKTPAHVLRMLEGVTKALRIILHIEGKPL